MLTNTSVATDVDGKYSFRSLTVGTYFVVEDCPSGWVQTYPNTDKDLGTCDYYTINVTSGFEELDNDFGNFKLGTKAGVKFDDVNGNATRDEGEPGIKDWTITLWTENGKADGLQMSGDDADASKSVKTDVDGKYSFGSLTVGTYFVVEDCPSGWVQTYPTTDKDLGTCRLLHDQRDLRVRGAGQRLRQLQARHQGRCEVR